MTKVVKRAVGGADHPLHPHQDDGGGGKTGQEGDVVVSRPSSTPLSPSAERKAERKRRRWKRRHERNLFAPF